MARIRTLKPEMLADEKLAKLPPITRLVFAALILLADDKGRLLDNVKTLDGQIFPETDESCGESLDTLARMSRISRYVADSGQKVIQLVNWDRHQRVDKPSKYNLPGPPSATSLSETTSSDLATSSRDSREIPGLRPTTSDHLPTTKDHKNASAAPRSTSSTGKTFDPIAIDLPAELQTDEFRAAWREFAEHRAEKRKPITKSSADKLIAKCARVGSAVAVAALEDAIAGGWTGVFPKSEDTKPAASRRGAVATGPGQIFHANGKAAVDDSF